MSTVREIMVDIGGQNYSIVSDDIYLEHLKNGFEPEMVQLFGAVARDSEVILDIGANIGCTALLFGGLANNVYAFEPSQTTFAFLKRKDKDSCGAKPPHNPFELSRALYVVPAFGV